MIDVLVPKWGLTMDEADVLRWLKQVGDQVTEGEPILELETDKATGEVESPANGVLAETFVQSGDTVEPGQLVGRIETA
jgi:2-oxoglutarate dehydrogenase E2 component (dihydrolipoamide succinyltransferase)